MMHWVGGRTLAPVRLASRPPPRIQLAPSGRRRSGTTVGTSARPRSMEAVRRSRPPPARRPLASAAVRRVRPSRSLHSLIRRRARRPPVGRAGAEPRGARSSAARDWDRAHAAGGGVSSRLFMDENPAATTRGTGQGLQHGLNGPLHGRRQRIRGK